MTREELEARAEELGISFSPRIGDENLLKRIEEAEQGEGDKPSEVKSDEQERIVAKVLWANVWSSEQKHFKDEVFGFLPDDFELLDSKDAIKRV